MKKTTLFALAFCFATVAHAVDKTTPGSESKEAVKKIQDTGGALKVEKKSAVPPEALQATEPSATLPPLELKPTKMETEPKTSSTPTDSSAHMFGLHGALGLPHPINFGLNYVHPSKIFSVEVSTGSYSAKLSGVDVTLANTEASLRWHPWMGSFYAGASVGTQKITAEKTDLVSGQSVTANAEIKGTYLTPHFGWMWGMEDGGFFVSLDMGYQMMSGVTVSLSSNVPTALVNTQEYIDLEKKVKDDGEKYGKMPLPHLTLLKLGWLF